MSDQPLTDEERQALLGAIDGIITHANNHAPLTGSFWVDLRRKLEGTDKQLLVRNHGAVDLSPASATTTSPEARPRPRKEIDKELRINLDIYLNAPLREGDKVFDWLLQQDGLTGARFAAMIAEDAVHLEKPQESTHRRIRGLSVELAERELRLREQATPTPRRVSTLRDGRYVEKF